MRFGPTTMLPLPPDDRRRTSVSLPARAFLAMLAVLPGCSTVSSVSNVVLGPSGPPLGQPGHVRGFLGGVVADEPRAALAGRDVLSAGGSAADAAVTVALSLAVTYPSRAGLGGGGACLAFVPDTDGLAKGVPQAVIFNPLAPATAAVNADRPAAIPMLARGLFLLHAQYGVLPFEALVGPAERMAASGVPASRALVKDLALVAGPLLADPGARSVFSRNGVPLTEGQTLRQPDLAGTLGQIRGAGVGDLYQGAMAHRIAQESPQTGGPLTFEDLRGALPKLAVPLIQAYHNNKIAFLPPPADGGLAAQAAFDTLSNSPGAVAAANARALAVAARYRAGGVTPDQVLAATNLTAAPPVLFPASTSFVTLDRDGNAVACVLTLDNLFGTGRMLPGLGFLAAASPAAVPPPLLAAGLVWNDRKHAFLAAAAGSGQSAAPLAVAVTLIDTLQTGRSASGRIPDPGRANTIACAKYLPGDNASCDWTNDPRESGLAVGSN